MEMLTAASKDPTNGKKESNLHGRISAFPFQYSCDATQESLTKWEFYRDKHKTRMITYASCCYCISNETSNR